ncbi:DUF1428 domain-containing protein [Sphingobium algorifonticola]|uniref:DUF1428 domain-containing protein n=1 Tax=Sphingobium algorifonticola TaxID=2008318 RepID=A0A437J984_9SPHN|nr:DUF1428 domain-containing protein [Sphingobium algorifonticola]RVT41953.1 DUF1428 domain-containing protein [Sphingobium algorifonticola]
MAYIDGVLVPVPVAEQENYAAWTARVSPLFLEYGATRVFDGWGDDIKDGKINDMRTAVVAAQQENVVFSWIEWPSKAVRDEGWEKLMADPRMNESGQPPFDGTRMIFGGFAPIVDISIKNGNPS